MANITENRLYGILAEKVVENDFLQEGFQVYRSKRIGFDQLSILLDQQGRLQQIYAVEIKFSSTETPSTIKLSTLQQKFRNLARKTHLDHLTITVSKEQIQNFVKENANSAVGGVI